MKVNNITQWRGDFAFFATHLGRTDPYINVRISREHFFVCLHALCISGYLVMQIFATPARGCAKTTRTVSKQVANCMYSMFQVGCRQSAICTLCFKEIIPKRIFSVGQSSRLSAIISGALHHARLMASIPLPYSNVWLSYVSHLITYCSTTFSFSSPTLIYKLFNATPPRYLSAVRTFPLLAIHTIQENSFVI